MLLVLLLVVVVVVVVVELAVCRRYRVKNWTLKCRCGSALV